MSAELREKCAVFGAIGDDFRASNLAFFGLYAQQHRGQEGSGITVSDGYRLLTHKEPGLVTQVYNPSILKYLDGYAAIGHNRYSTSGGMDINHIQPVIDDDAPIALAHNGNLPSIKRLAEFLEARAVPIDNANDSELMQRMIKYYFKRGATFEDAIIESYPKFEGVFSMLVMTKDKIAAMRDPCGVRPLSIGKLNGGYIFASETCALDTVNTKLLRDVMPGEIVFSDGEELRSVKMQTANQKLDIFCFVYFARPESLLLGKRVNEVRRNMGRNLALELPEIKADVVVPVPDTSIPAAEGFTEISGIPVRQGLIKNRYIHRTFITPEEHVRKNAVRMKFNPIPEVVENKIVAVMDDSIVRGNTYKIIIEMLREAGAKKIIALVCSARVKYPDFYGIDTPHQDQLLAAKMDLEQSRDYLGADELRYLSYQGMIDATGLPEGVFNTSAFTGNYPVDIGERVREIVRVS